MEVGLYCNINGNPRAPTPAMDVQSHRIVGEDALTTDRAI